MSPRPTPQPITRAPRPEHPLARQEPAPTPAPAGLPADQQTSSGLSGRQRSEWRQDAVFFTRVPAGVKKQLRRYAFERDLLVTYLAEHDT